MPSCIQNFQYDDYSIFVGKKHVKLTWDVTNSAEAANYTLYYYVADERTLYNGSNNKGNDSWSQLRMYTYGTKYTWDLNYKRFTHIDQGPWSKTGVTYSAMLEDLPLCGALDPDASGNLTGRIGTVTSMTPLLVGRSIKWDDPTTFANGEKVVKTVSLTAGELDLGEIDGKSLCVFFMIRNTATGDNYYGPDKQTNSTDAGKRHFSYSMLPWNGCWMSVNLCVPMPVKVSWSSTKDGEYTEVACGTDVEFPGDSVLVKLELNTEAFPSAAGKVIWYNTSSLQPVQTTHNTDDKTKYKDEYDEYYIESKQYDGTPICLKRNTVLRYAVYSDGGMVYGQNSTSGYNALFPSSGYYSDIGNSKSAYSRLTDKIAFTYPDYEVPPIYTNLREHYLWGNTFVKATTKKVPLRFERSIPNSSWVEYLTGRYGLGSGAYTYQTYVPEKPLLIPSSLEGIVDFFIILSGKESAIQATNRQPTLSRVNWVPAGMPVIVRYRNYSAPNSLATPEAAETNMANMMVQLTGENLGTDHERLPACFLTPDGDYTTRIDSYLGTNSLFYPSYTDHMSFKYFDGSGPSFTDFKAVSDHESGETNPLTDETVYVDYQQKTDADGNKLYYYQDPSGNQSSPLYQKLNDDGQPLYHAVNTDGDKLYYYYGDGYIPSYQRTDADGNRLWYLLDDDGYTKRYAVKNAAGEQLYYYQDENGNRMYHQLDNYEPLFYVTDGDGNKLYHKEDDSYNKLYYEYYTEAGSTEKNHLYLYDGESYQQVNGSNERLYAALDEDGNQLYHKVDASGNKLYYQRESTGTGWVHVYNVIAEKDGAPTVNIPNQVEPAIPVMRSYYEGQGYTVTATPVEVTEGNLKGGSTATNSGAPVWSVETTEVTGYPLTTTTPNAYPLIDEDGSSYVLAYTTAATDAGYATTTDENDWPVTITASDDSYTDSLDPVTTTTANAYPVLTTDETGCPFLGPADASQYVDQDITCTINTDDPYWVAYSGDVPTFYTTAGYSMDESTPRTITENDNDFSTYRDAGRLQGYTTYDASLGYPPYCGEENEYNVEGYESQTDYPVEVTESTMYGYALTPIIYNYNDGYQGDVLYTTEYNDYPAKDYDRPIKRNWALTTGQPFVPIDQFPNRKTTDYVSTMEPQEFIVYDGTSDRAYWYPEYQCYHLSSRAHRDEGNFYNVLHCLKEEKSVSDIESETGGTVYGLAVDHVNTWIGANCDIIYNDHNATFREYAKIGVERNTDIGLHLTAFSQKYRNHVLTGDPTSSEVPAPVLDDWLVYAPLEAGINYGQMYEYPFMQKLFGFYYGYFLNDHDPSSSDAVDYRSATACAAWKRVSTTSANKMQPGKAFLVWKDNSFGQPSEDPERDEAAAAKLSMTAMAELTPEWSSAPWWDDDEVTAIGDVRREGVGGGSEAVYDLQGRRVADSVEHMSSSLQRGIYIVGGKKIVVK